MSSGTSLNSIQSFDSQSSALEELIQGRQIINSDEESNRTSSSSVDQIRQHFEREPNLYQLIFDLKYSIEHIINECINKFESDLEEGVLILIQFIVSCCGCEGEKITLDTLNRYQGPELICNLVKWMENNYEKNPSKDNHPIIEGGKKANKFLSIVNDFWIKFVKKCPDSILCAELMDEIIVPLLITISSSIYDDEYNKTFILVSTSIALKIATGILCKMSSNGNLRRIFNIIFTKIYRHKIQINDNKLVVMCAMEYAEWFVQYPAVLEQDFAEIEEENWIFFDTSCLVKHVALNGLLKMFEKYINDASSVEKVIYNAVKIAHILLSDNIPNIVIDAINIFIAVHKIDPNATSHHSQSCIFYLVYHEHPQVSKAAANYLNQILMEDSEIHNSSDYLKNLVVFYNETYNGRSIVRLINSLYGLNNAIVDWNAMVELLTRQSTDDNEDEIILVKIIVACIKEAIVSDHLNKEKLDKDGGFRKQITKYFGELIIPLIQKYKTRNHALDERNQILSKVLEIPRCFDANILIKQEPLFLALINELCIILENETDDVLLQTASKTLCALKNFDKNICNNSILALSEKLINNFIAIYGNYKGHMVNNQLLSQEQFEKFSIATKQLFALYLSHDLNQHQLWDTLIKALIMLLKYFQKTNIYSVYIVIYLVRIASISLIWNKLTYNANVDTTESLSSGLEDKLRNDKAMFDKVVTTILEDKYEEFGYILKREVFKASCDVAWRLNKFTADEKFALALSQFVDDYIFSDKFEKDPNDPLIKTQKDSIDLNILLLSTYCKLIIYNRQLYKTKTIIKHYVKTLDIYDNTIKETVKQLANNNRELTINELFFVLVYDYMEATDVNTANDNLQATAKNFSKLIHLTYNDTTILQRLHERVIQKVSTKKDCSYFFPILIAFGYKMSAESKKKLLKMLQQKCPTQNFYKDSNIKEYKEFLHKKPSLYE